MERALLSPKTDRFGFTLIELLIVVAIIAILAAIAVPNFLEAQVRSKVSRTKADHRTIATALEAYYVDKNSYPATGWVNVSTNYGYYTGLGSLTTPVSFITTVPSDPFSSEVQDANVYQKFFEYGAGKAGAYASQVSDTTPLSGMRYPSNAWILSSSGPDKTDNSTNQFRTTAYPWVGTRDLAANDLVLQNTIYDPTNGTVSSGDVVRAGGEVPPEGPVGRYIRNLK